MQAIKEFEVAESSTKGRRGKTKNYRNSISKLIFRRRKLGFTLRKPFDMMMNLGEYPNWLPALLEFRTFRMEIVNTMSRQNLH